MEFNEMYDYLLEVVGVSAEALDLAFSLCGCTKETADAICFYYTGWRDIESHAKDMQEM